MTRDPRPSALRGRHRRRARPGQRPGNWSGAASAVLVDGVYWLTYRVRRPLREGRGVSVVVARSEDGEHFVTVAEVRRDEFGAESFERPVLVRRPDGGWRLYVSCATPGSKHWWIEAVDADEPARPRARPPHRRAARRRPTSRSRTRSCSSTSAGWRMWVCVHPLTEPGHEDRMTTAYATSADGLAWDWHGTVLRPDRRHLGPARHPGHRRAQPRARSSCCTTAAPAPRTTGTRSPGWPARPTAATLVADDGPVAALAAQRRRPALRRRGPAARRRHPRSTSRPPAPTARTT